MIYYPQPSALATPANTLQMSVAGTDILVSTQTRTTDDALLFFGGNAEDVSQQLPEFAQAFPRHAIYMLHYRSYGGSAGSPSEEAIQQDALALFDLAHAKHANIVVIGRSLGSGVAVRLASQRPAAKLVLITPYDSLQAIAALQYPYLPVRWLLMDKYESWRYAARISIPTLLVVAENDEVIPRAHSERLYSHFIKGVATIKTINGADHSTILDGPGFLPIMNDFLYRLPANENNFPSREKLLDMRDKAP